MNLLIDASMAVGPVVGYVHQYHVIRKSKSVGTFSIDICGILLFANILRLNFYVFEHYQLALLFQSIIMILAQVLLVRICSKFMFKNKQAKSQWPSQGSFDTEKTQNLDHFWRWRLFSTYLLFILFFTFVTFSVTTIFNQFQMRGYGVLIGLIALLSQSVLIFPQLLKNFHNQSTKGLSYVLVSLNLFGDIFKLVYFILNVQPFQFILCGVIQVILDSFVIIQIFWYKRAKYNVDDKEARVLSPKSSVENQIKPETEKNLDDIQMENMPQVSGQIQQIISFESVDKSQIQNDENNQTFGEKHHNSSSPQKIIDKKYSKQIIEQENDIKIELNDEFTDRQTNEKIQIRPPNTELKKIHSEEPLPNSVSEGQFLAKKLIHASKSLENIHLEC